MKINREREGREREIPKERALMMKIDREKVWSSVEYTIQSLSKYNT